MITKWPYHFQDEIDAVADVLRSGKTNYWSGPHGQAFESEFAAYTGAKHALSVTNGTTALEAALYATRRMGEVIVPCRTFMATASAVVTAGCIPVLADIDALTLNVSVDTLDARRTSRTVAVIVVHYAGLPCDMYEICKWAKRHNIVVIEDCAHAHGAFICDLKDGKIIDRRHVGTFGDVGCFSFCVGKTMSTGGEGGMVITNNEILHNNMAARRDHGRYQMMGTKDMTQFQWTVEAFGTNLRMTEMQSAIGRLQLKRLDGWVDRRNEIADAYGEILNNVGDHKIDAGMRHGRYMHMAVIEDRDRIMKELISLGVPARLGGCPNIGREAVFNGEAAECPIADGIGERTLSLPVYPTMTDQDVDEVLSAARKVCG